MLRALKHGLAASALALPIATIAPAPAEAGCCGTLYTHISRSHATTRTQVTRNVNQHTTQVGNYIVDNILKATQQLSAYEARTAESNKRVEEGAQANAVIRERQRMRALAEGGRYDPAVNACVDLSGIMSMGDGSQAEGFGGHDMANVSRNRSNGNGAEGEEVRAGYLAIANGVIRDRDELKNVGGLLDPTSDFRLVTENLTLDTSDGDISKAYARLVNNIIDPTPARPVSAGEMRTPQGKAHMAARQFDGARRSTAHAVMAFYGDLVAPSGSSELADWARNAAPSSYPNNIGDKVSKLQALDVFVHNRFANPEWHQHLAKMSPEAVSRELLLTMALNQHINWLQFQLDLRTAAVDATTLTTILDGRDSSGTGGATNASGSTMIPAAPGVMNVALPTGQGA